MKNICFFAGGLMIGWLALKPEPPPQKEMQQIDMKKLKEITYKMPEILSQIDALYAINLNHKRGSWAAMHFVDRAKKMTFDVLEELIELVNPQLMGVARRIKEG